MLFLILAMLASSVLAMVLKYLNSSSPYGVYFVNYITCALLAFAAMEPKALYNGDLTPCWLGGITGLIYLASLTANGYSIHKNGAILSSVFTRLGVLVPILLSVTLFGERPTLVQGLGVALAVAAAVIMNGLPSKTGASSVAGKVYLLPLILTLLLNGTSDAMSKVFTQLGRRQDDGLFMFYIFLFAGVATLVLLVRERRSLTGRDVLFGVLVGVPNFLSSRLLLAALTQLPAFLVYPSYSVGVILVISVASFFLFRERLNGRQMVAAGMILGALVLLNL
ncbi:EamA family transporter [uncultured Gemmiger sp.]|uniref:EamA family transporter n=1 Tax=uncultured Gemmiger sp. TaxID=1623490 RepID=UPI0025CE9C48|nr:EamA family transporter [uncultured Gemmiger sp.]